MHLAAETAHDSARLRVHLQGQQHHRHFYDPRAMLLNLDNFPYEMLHFCYHLLRLRQLLQEAKKQ